MKIKLKLSKSELTSLHILVCKSAEACMDSALNSADTLCFESLEKLGQHLEEKLKQSPKKTYAIACDAQALHWLYNVLYSNKLNKFIGEYETMLLQGIAYEVQLQSEAYMHYKKVYYGTRKENTQNASLLEKLKKPHTAF